MTPEYNLNPDNSFMSANQILADIVQNRMSLDLQKLLTFDFSPPVSQDERIRRMNENFNPDSHARMMFGRWIRNSYGLWEATNPHTMRQLDESAVRNGVDYHPCHPDSFSDEIITRLVAYYANEPVAEAA